MTWHPSSIIIRPSVVRRKLSHLNLLLWNPWTKSGKDGPWVGPFQNCVWQKCAPFKMAAVTKNRNFFNCPLLLYYKSKWAQILTAATLQWVVLHIIRVFPSFSVEFFVQPIYTNYANWNYIFSNSSHLEWRAELLDTILKWDYPRTIPAKFGLIWLSGFREEDLNVIFYQNMPNLHDNE
jgi:hypothetical protein